MSTEKKRVRRVFNGSDLFFILVIVIAIAAVIFLRGNISKTDVTASDKTVNIEYTIEFKKLDNSVTTQIKEGDRVRDPDNKQFIGTVVSVQAEAYTEISYNYSDGGAYLAGNPDYTNMLVTIKAAAQHTESGYYVNGARFLVGKQNHIWSNGFAGSGFCISIRETE